MRFIPWFLFYIILLIASLLTFIIYLLGAAYYLTNNETNTCDMTYMFEYPQYVRVMLNDDVENKFSRYSLYAYGEGFITERLRKMKFTGIPVLFIPGNAGSHEQVRSLASVSLRKSLNDRTYFHFDYFTVSFGKDYSALYGGLLMDETIYVSHCINKILSLYNGKINNLVIIGHSMGGIVAKGALLLTPNSKPFLASILITLATPHRPAIVFDKTFVDYYDKIDKAASSLREAGVTVISIGGGHKDTLVTSAQTIDYNANISTLSTSIPSVWRSTDHLCILWCKQLILSINRALFDCVDTSRRPALILKDPIRNIKAFSYHLINRYSSKKFDIYEDKLTFHSNAVWLPLGEDTSKQISWKGIDSLDNIPKNLTILLKIPVFHHVNNFDTIVIDTIGLESKDWLFAYNANNPKKWGWNLTNKTRQAPDFNYKLRKTVDLSMVEFNGEKLFSNITDIVIKIQPEDRKNAIINVDFFKNQSRITTFETNCSHNYIPWKNAAILLNIKKGNLRHYIHFDGIVDAVSMELKALKCHNDDDAAGNALVELVESWNPTITQFSFFTKSDNGPKTFKIQQVVYYSNALFKMLQVNNSVHIRITTKSDCQYTFEIKKGSIFERISVLVRDRWPILYQVSIALLLLNISLKIDSDRFSTVGITVFIVYAVMEIHIECVVMFFMLHTMSFGICCSIIFLGSIAHKIASRFLARVIMFSVTWSEWLIGGLNQLPICKTVIIMSIIPTTCGALAMILTVFMYFLKLTQMYEDYLEELLLSSMRHVKLIKSKKSNEIDENTRTKILNHLVIFMLICLSALPAVPSVLVWAKNFGIASELKSEDPILLYSWIVIIICSMMDLVQIPKTITLRTQFLGYILCVISWIILYISSAQNVVHNIWWMPPCVATSVFFISLNSIIP